MKASILYCLMISMIILGWAPKKSTPIEGAWHVVSWEQMAGDSLISKVTVVSWEQMPGGLSNSQIHERLHRQ